jgi:serine protease Do
MSCLSRACAVLLLTGLAAACSDPRLGGAPDLADVVEKASPSVVNISTIGPEHGAAGQAPMADEQTPEWFRRFLEENSPGSGEAPPEEVVPEGPANPQSLGTGFILWEDGYVLTNFHVVEGSREVIVRLLDRRQLSARIVGVDERSDLALLKIDARNLPAVKLADSRKLRPGESVFAIGSPFSFDYSVTAGIVSAKGCNLQSEQYVPFIQTDVAINPGNSGGPLFNMKGEVVGVNSQIYSQNGGFQGVSFSIPIDVAAKVARQLRDTGKVTRGWLGVVVQEVDRNLAQTFGMEKPEGALVSKIVEDSPAEEAGLKDGDVLLSFDGEPLETSSDLPPLVGSVDPGEVVSLVVMREGRKIDFKVEIDVLKDDESEPVPQVAPRPAPEPELPAVPAPGGEPLGLVVSSLSDDDRRQLRVLSGGVQVEAVRRGPAASAGLRVGDVILTIAGQEIDSPERLAEVAGRLTPGSTVPILVSRDGAPTFYPLEIPGN